MTQTRTKASPQASIIALLLIAACASVLFKPPHVDSDWPLSHTLHVASPQISVEVGYCSKFVCVADPADFAIYGFLPPIVLWLAEAATTIGINPIAWSQLTAVLGLLSIFVGTWLATAKRSQNAPLLALAAVYSPIVLASYTSGNNEPLVSGASVLGLGLLIRALDPPTTIGGAASGIVAGLALLVRYRPGVALLFATVVAAFDSRRRALALAHILGTLAVFALWQLAFTYNYGMPHPLPLVYYVKHLGITLSGEFSPLAQRVGAFAPTIGAALLSPLVGALLLVVTRSRAVPIMAALAALITFVAALSIQYPLREALWPAALGATGGAALASLFNLHKHSDDTAHTLDPVTRFAAPALFAFALLASFGVSFTNARYFIAALPFILLSIEFALRRATSPHLVRTHAPAIIAALTIPVGATVQWADTRFARAANAATEWAIEQRKDQPGKLWHVHQWGVETRLAAEPNTRFLTGHENAYAADLGGRDENATVEITIVRRERPAPGDACLRVSNVTLVQQENLDAWCPGGDGALVWASQDTFPLRVIDFEFSAGLYSDGWGLAPYTLGRGPLVRARIDFVRDHRP